jgi:hypothetical protein
MTMEYKVSWTIDRDADSPEEAARQALEIHRDPESWATHFEVRDGTGQVCEVDLGVLPHPSAGHTVYVLVPMEEGIVHSVEVYASEDGVQRAEQEWLSTHGLAGESAGEQVSDFGTGIAIWECELKD